MIQALKFIFALVAAIAAVVTIWAFFFPRPTAAADGAFAQISDSTNSCDFADFISQYPTDPIFTRRARERLGQLEPCAEDSSRLTAAEVAAEVRRVVRRATARIRDASATESVSQPLSSDMEAVIDRARQATDDCQNIWRNGFSQNWYDGTYYGENIRGTWLGCGYYAFRNGDRHIGRWGPTGDFTYGKYEFADGRQYEGQFLNIAQAGYDMKIEGFGVLWSADGEIQAQGYWRDGQIISR